MRHSPRPVGIGIGSSTQGTHGAPIIPVPDLDDPVDLALALGPMLYAVPASGWLEWLPHAAQS